LAKAVVYIKRHQTSNTKTQGLQPGLFEFTEQNCFEMNFIRIPETGFVKPGKLSTYFFKSTSTCQSVFHNALFDPGITKHVLFYCYSGPYK
jgi:hypothetical protein